MSVKDQDGDLQSKKTRIADFTKKTTKNGNEYVLVEDADGDYYSVWEDSWQDTLLNDESYRSGRVDITYVTKGDYRNVKMVQRIDDDSIDEDSGPVLSRDERIKHQWAVKVAAQTLPEKHRDNAAKWDDVLFDRAETIMKEAEKRWNL